MSPSTTIVLGLSPAFQLRSERGAGAGPCRTVPSRRNREPWHGQSNVLSVVLNPIGQPRCEQLIANTCVLPFSSLTANPPNARSPAPLSPPPLAMMKAELGLVGASNLTASPGDSSVIALSRVIGMAVFFWPFGGAGQRKTRIGANPTTTVEVKRLAIHHPMNVRRVNFRGVESAIRPEF